MKYFHALPLFSRFLNFEKKYTSLNLNLKDFFLEMGRMENDGQIAHTIRFFFFYWKEGITFLARIATAKTQQLS